MNTKRSLDSLFFSLVLLAILALPSGAANASTLIPPIPPNAVGVHCSTSDSGTVCHWTAPFGTPSTGAPYGYVTCNASQVIVTLLGEMKVNAFYNQSGQLELMQRHISYSGTLSNPATGKSVPHEGHATVTLDFQTNTTTITGLYHFTVLPGEGMVFLDAGIVMVAADGTISFVGGPHDYYLHATQDLCTALS